MATKESHKRNKIHKKAHWLEQAINRDQKALWSGESCWTPRTAPVSVGCVKKSSEDSGRVLQCLTEVGSVTFVQHKHLEEEVCKKLWIWQHLHMQCPVTSPCTWIDWTQGPAVSWTPRKDLWASSDNQRKCQRRDWSRKNDISYKSTC